MAYGSHSACPAICIIPQWGSMVEECPICLLGVGCTHSINSRWSLPKLGLRTVFPYSHVCFPFLSDQSPFAFLDVCTKKHNHSPNGNEIINKNGELMRKNSRDVFIFLYGIDFVLIWENSRNSEISYEKKCESKTIIDYIWFLFIDNRKCVNILWSCYNAIFLCSRSLITRISPICACLLQLVARVS